MTKLEDLKGNNLQKLHIDEAAFKEAQELVGETGVVTNFKRDGNKYTYDVEPKKPECTITTKQGDHFKLDLSASQVKKLRRAKKKIEMERDGKRYVLDCAKIVDIVPTLA